MAFPQTLTDFAARGLQVLGLSSLKHSVLHEEVEKLLVGPILFNVRSSAFAGGAKGDGLNDDRTAIQSALDTGEDVLCPPGIYRLTLAPSQTHALQMTRPGQTLRLAPGAVLKLADGQLSGSALGSVVKVGDGTTAPSNVAILGPGRIDGNRANNASTGDILQCAGIRVHGTGSDIAIEGVEVIETVGDGIVTDGTASRITRFAVRGCTLRNCGEGIVWQFTDYAVIESNLLENIITQDAIEPSQSRYYSIVGNVVNGAGQGGIDVFTGSSFGVVIGNTIRDVGRATPQAGISVAGSSEVVVAGNTLVGGDATPGTGLDGIVIVSTASRVSVVGNIVVDADDNGIQVDGPDCVVANNYVGGSWGEGIWVQPSGDRCAVLGNHVRNNNRSASGGTICGILLQTCDRVTCKDNTCYDDQGTPTQSHGIIVSGATNSVVEGNHLFGNRDGQLSDSGGTGTVLRGNVGFNPQGTATISVGASPFTYTAGRTPEAVYIRGGTVSDISKNARTIFTQTEQTVWLEPGESVVVTYSAAPTMEKDRK